MTSNREGKGAPTSYADLAKVIDALPLLVAEHRRRLGLSMRGLAAEWQVSFSTVHRIEAGEDYNSRILPDILRWLGTRP